MASRLKGVDVYHPLWVRRNTRVEPIAMGDDAARKARWEEAGRPLFGKFYTKQEIEVYNKNKLKGRGAQPHAHLETPAEWPKDTVIDPGQWVYWLPEGWKQGIRTSATGKTLKCYFTPDHWRFWHRKDIEKEGYELGAAEPPRKNKENKEEEEKRIRYVTDHDAVPNWPDEGWLPDDWRLGMRALPSGLMRIFQPPNQEEGFFFHKSQVLEYLSGGSPSLTAISASMTMEERLGFQPRKKRKKSQATYASLADYSEVKGFSILKLPASEKELKPFGADGKKLVAGCREIEEGLLRRTLELTKEDSAFEF